MHVIKQYSTGTGLLLLFSLMKLFLSKCLFSEKKDRTLILLIVRPAGFASKYCLMSECFLSSSSTCKGNSDLWKVTPMLIFKVSPTSLNRQYSMLIEIWPLPSFPNFFSKIPSVNPLFLTQMPRSFVILCHV